MFGPGGFEGWRQRRRNSRPLLSWRKIAVATWGQPNDPQIYGDLEVDATAALEFIVQVRETTGERLTLTHLTGKAMAHALSENPDLNGRLYRGRFVPRDTVDVFFIISAEAGQELTGVKIHEADTKPVADIARELRGRAERIHAGDDQEMGRTRELMARVPPRLLGVALRLAAWLTADLDLHLPALSLPRQAFGSVMVSSVGMFGIQHAYAPLSPYYRVPLLVLVGEVAPRAVVVDGEVVARPILTLSATLDHRYLDGFHAARLSRSIRAYLGDPGAFEPSPH